MLNIKTIFVFLFWGLIAATTIFLLQEVTPTPQTWPKDKLQHAVTFALLTYLGIKSYPKHALYIAIFLAFYGGLVEFLQSQFTQTRTGSYADWLADLFGILLAYYALNLLKNRLQNKYERI